MGLEIGGDFHKDFNKRQNKMFGIGIGMALVALIVNVGLFVGACFIVKWIFF